MCIVKRPAQSVSFPKGSTVGYRHSIYKSTPRPDRPKVCENCPQHTGSTASMSGSTPERTQEKPSKKSHESLLQLHRSHTDDRHSLRHRFSTPSPCLDFGSPCPSGRKINILTTRVGKIDTKLISLHLSPGMVQRWITWLNLSTFDRSAGVAMVKRPGARAQVQGRTGTPKYARHPSTDGEKVWWPTSEVNFPPHWA